MNAHDRSKAQWGSKKLERIMERGHEAMKNHGHLFESGPGQFAGVMLSGCVAMVAIGATDKGDLEKSVKLASEISGIPIDAMSAFADFAMAMHCGAIQSQCTSPFVGGSDE